MIGQQDRDLAILICQICASHQGPSPSVRDVAEWLGVDIGDAPSLACSAFVGVFPFISGTRDAYLEAEGIIRDGWSIGDPVGRIDDLPAPDAPSASESARAGRPRDPSASAGRAS